MAQYVFLIRWKTSEMSARPFSPGTSRCFCEEERVGRREREREGEKGRERNIEMVAQVNRHVIVSQQSPNKATTPLFLSPPSPPLPPLLSPLSPSPRGFWFCPGGQSVEAGTSHHSVKSTLQCAGRCSEKEAGVYTAEARSQQHAQSCCTHPCHSWPGQSNGVEEDGRALM